MLSPPSPEKQQELYQRLGFGPETLTHLCQKWKIQEFALFGSILRQDFRPDSDIDILITFLPNERWDLFDILHLKQELEALTQRSVDLAQKNLLRNPYRRSEILKTHKILYATQRSDTRLPVGHDRRDRSTPNLPPGQNL
ncbi:MAG: nucleotidyltransferase family protein [Prochlorothrix sp.]